MKTELTLGLGFLASILLLSGIGFAQGFQDVIGTLKEIGIFQFYLPFLIVFAIIFGLLQKVKVFGDTGRPLNIIVALAIAGFVMVYVPQGIQFSQFLTNFAGNTVVVILTFIVALIFISMLQSGKLLPDQFSDIIKGSTIWILILVALLIVFGIFVASGGTAIFPGIKISAKPAFQAIGGLSATTWAIVILIVGTGLIVWLLREPKTPAGGKGPGG